MAHFNDDQRDIVGEPGRIPGPSDHFFHHRGSEFDTGFRGMLGDGGVRFLSGNVSDSIWQRAVDPRDGAALPAGW